LKIRGITLNNSIPGPPDFWRHLFSPSSVAVIGASNTPGSWGNNALKGVLVAGNKKVYPVNPNSPEILGIKAYRSVTEIPDAVDIAVIVVPEKLVPGVLRECVSKSIRAAIIITSGFAETGEQGRKLEAELVDISRRGGIRFIGPNSMGHADTGSRMSTFGQTGEMKPGPVAVLSQSGSTCMKIVRALGELGVGCSKYVSTGNEASLYIEDYLEFLARDDDTKVILAYIEGLRDGRRFYGLAKEITREKPIVVVKVGGTEESARAVMSHTGALAGSDAVYSAAFRQSGVIRVEDDDELCDVAYALVSSPLPRNNRIGILSIGGGQAALTAEICEREGLAVGRLEPATVEKLDKILPPRWPRRNPVDMAGPTAADLSQISDLLWPLIEDKNLDNILLLVPIIMDTTVLTGRMGLKPEQVQAYREKEERDIMLIRQNIEKYQKPVALIWQGRGVNSDPSALTLLRKGKILAFSNTRRTARVISLLFRYRRYLDTLKGKNSL
jgi:acyl-CoA synthetase (NDP forming)